MSIKHGCLRLVAWYYIIPPKFSNASKVFALYAFRVTLPAKNSIRHQKRKVFF